MSRGICPRVNSVGCFWIFSLLTFAVKVIDVDTYSCYEVRTAFQQVGPLNRVPETPVTGERVGLAPMAWSTLAKAHYVRLIAFQKHFSLKTSEVITLKQTPYLKGVDDVMLNQPRNLTLI